MKRDRSLAAGPMLRTREGFVGLKVRPRRRSWANEARWFIACVAVAAIVLGLFLMLA